MNEFVYKAITATGQTVEGAMEGKDEKSIIQSLHQMGYIPLRVSAAEIKRSPGALSAFLPKRVGLQNLLVFSQELETLVSAGLPIDRSLKILVSMTENRKLQDVIRDVLRKIEGGSSLGDALESHPKTFPKLYVNMVKAGETGGFLDVILARIVNYLQSSKELRDSVVSAMIYPLILTVVSGLSIAILVTYVIPRFAGMFADMGQAMPLPTQIVLSLSQVVQDYWYMIGGAVLLAYVGLKAYIQHPARKLQWDSFKLRVMMVGDLIKKVEIARFARTMGTLLQSGVPILTALNLVKEISQNMAIAETIGHVHDRLREGKGVAKALEEKGVFPPLAVHMIAVGEETGKLDEMLHKIAGTFEENIKTTVKRFVSLLEPLIILLMGAIIGFIVISMLLAIFGMTDIKF